jgi:hypothetical protein
MWIVQSCLVEFGDTRDMISIVAVRGGAVSGGDGDRDGDEVGDGDAYM